MQLPNMIQFLTKHVNKETYWKLCAIGLGDIQYYDRLSINNPLSTMSIKQNVWYMKAKDSICIVSKSGDFICFQITLVDGVIRVHPIHISILNPFHIHNLTSYMKKTIPEFSLNPLVNSRHQEGSVTTIHTQKNNCTFTLPWYMQCTIICKEVQHVVHHVVCLSVK